jgi:hypothetical protein
VAAWKLMREECQALSDAEAAEAESALGAFTGPQAVVLPGVAAYPQFLSASEAGRTASQWFGTAAKWVVAATGSVVTQPADTDTDTPSRAIDLLLAATVNPVQDTPAADLERRFTRHAAQATRATSRLRTTLILGPDAEAPVSAASLPQRLLRAMLGNQTRDAGWSGAICLPLQAPDAVVQAIVDVLHRRR